MCVNTPGSFMCICHTGYIRIDDYSCTGELLCWPFDRLELSGEGPVFILTVNHMKRLLADYTSSTSRNARCAAVKKFITSL